MHPPRERPLGDGRLQRLLPFAAATVAGVAAILLPFDGRPDAVTLWGVAVLLAVPTAAVSIPWARLPAWTEMLPAVAFVVGVALLRHGGGGGASGFAPLLVLPLLYVGLYGTRVEGAVIVAVSVLALAVPVALLDAERYPDTEWRRTVLWLLVASAVVATVQSLVRAVRTRATALAALGRATPTVIGSATPEATTCEAARAVLGADMAVWLARDADGVRVTEAVGGRATSLVDTTWHWPAATTAWASGRRVVDEDLDRNAPDLHAAGARAAVVQPVHRVDGTPALLVAVFDEGHVAHGDHVGEVLGLLATTASTATERRDLLAALQQQADRDPLTGAANRRVLELVLERERARVRRSDDVLCVAMLDLDLFKAFNDRHGHLAGDALLVETSRAWEAVLREADLLARYGGEEFAAVITGRSLHDAVAVAERLRAATPATTTVSIGVATWDGHEDTADLLARADAALYRAKAGGRDRVVTADPP